MVGALIILVVGIGAATTLLLLFGHGDPADVHKLDAIRTASTIVLGTGGGVALLLAARRQRSTELTLLHQLETSSFNERDLSERRVIESFNSAADQLGSDKAAVRLAGLYTLERLADSNADQRQTIVNLICAYLRMPFDPPSKIPPIGPPTLETFRETTGPKPVVASGLIDHELDTKRAEELEVRLAAQRILAIHLRIGSRDGKGNQHYWGAHATPLHVDLSGATLVQFTMAYCHLSDASFSNARFFGNTVFEGSRFSGYTTFRDSHFRGLAWFDRTRFYDRAVFVDCTVEWDAIFTKAQFRKWVFFEGVTFRRSAYFKEVQFRGKSSWDRCSFRGALSFHDAQFSFPLDLSKARAGRLKTSNERHFLPPGWSVAVDGDDAAEDSNDGDLLHIRRTGPGRGVKSVPTTSDE